MFRYIVFFIIPLVFCQTVFSQEVVGVHDIQAGNEPNEYTIKTTISGLEGVDIARIKYIINNDHTYKPSPNNTLFSDRNESYIKFYIMAVPPSGIINVEFGIVLGGTGENIFSVELQYSKNEVKQTVNLPKVDLSKNDGIIAVETPVPTPVVEEEPVVETPVPTPVVEEEPVVETPDPTPVVEEEPIVETPDPTPVVEEEPIIETLDPAPVVEEEPEPLNTNNRISSTKYTVQLLSLLEFSQSRLKNYCRQHNLSITKIKKTQVGEWMKITYGEANSIQEANQIKDRLSRDNGINESFVTKVK